MIWIVFLLFSTLAFAEAAPAVGANALGPLLPLVLMFGVFYFLVIRPQQKKAKQHQVFLNDLKRGDMVITNGGVVGTVKTLSEKLVTLEIDEDVCMKVLRSQIADNANSLKDTPKEKS